MAHTFPHVRNCADFLKVIKHILIIFVRVSGESVFLESHLSGVPYNETYDELFVVGEKGESKPRGK